MALGWNEVKERAVQFSKEWENAYNEEADAKQFLIEFLFTGGKEEEALVPASVGVT